MAKINKKLLVFMIVLSFIGLATTSYQAYEHYFLSESFCDFSEQLSCGHITESRYGELPYESGIAASVWGIAQPIPTAPAARSANQTRQRPGIRLSRSRLSSEGHSESPAFRWSPQRCLRHRSVHPYRWVVRSVGQREPHIPPALKARPV